MIRDALNVIIVMSSG